MGINESIDFKVHSWDVPVSELRATFFEETRLNPSEYRLIVVDHADFFERDQNRHRGAKERRLHNRSTGQIINEMASKNNYIFDIDVVRVNNSLFDQRKKNVYHLNRLARKLSLKRAGKNQLPIGPELLNLVMEFSDVQDLYSCAQISTLWHTVAVRRSILVQLTEGDFSWASVEGYSYFLSNLGDHEMQLTVAAQGAAAVEQARIREFGFQKERDNGRGRYGVMYAKASGCTRARTVTHACFKTLELRFSKGHVDVRQRPPSRLTEQVFLKKRKVREFRNLIGLAPPKPSNVDSRIVKTWPSNGRLVAEAVDPNILRKVIRMFSSYFSPELNLIFPLICYQQNTMGLDFSSTQTWYMLDPNLEEREVGAISWRICRSASDKILEKMRITTSVEPVAEVLFIAVWERLRSNHYGGDLVDTVVADAVRQGVRLLYVEIGEEQPKAQDFWSEQGFMPLNQDSGKAGTTVELSNAQISFFDSVCFRFTDTRQWIRRL